MSVPPAEGLTSGVDVAQVADQFLEALGVVAAEVEAAQPGPVGVAAGDLVQRALHPGGEVVVDQLGEVPLQQGDDGERDEQGTSAVPFLNVAAVQDRADDRGVGGR
jgi:hypothetical protein